MKIRKHKIELKKIFTIETVVFSVYSEPLLGSMALPCFRNFVYVAEKEK
jgi:hypothetical protein